MTKRFKSAAVFSLILILIIFRFFLIRPNYPDGANVRITTTVYTDPVKYDTSQYLKVSGLKIYLPNFPEISYGDKVVIEGEISEGKLKKAVLLTLTENKNYFIGLREKLISFYQTTFPEPFAGLIGGIVIGSKKGLTGDFWEMVRAAGLTHVVVASGMNVSFVASFLLNFLVLFFPRRKAILFVILGIILYVFISGLNAPLIRAAIMAGVAFWAQGMGRIIASARALVISALIMLVVNPLWILDIGFILSFVATASLIIFEKRIREKISFIPVFLREGLSTSLAAQIGVAPIIFVTFGQFNLLSPLINALVLWTIPYIMIIGALGGVAGLIIPAIGKIILYLGYPFVWWFSYVVTLFGS